MMNFHTTDELNRATQALNKDLSSINLNKTGHRQLVDMIKARLFKGNVHFTGVDLENCNEIASAIKEFPDGIVLLSNFRDLIYKTIWNRDSNDINEIFLEQDLLEPLLEWDRLRLGSDRMNTIGDKHLFPKELEGLPFSSSWKRVWSRDPYSRPTQAFFPPPIPLSVFGSDELNVAHYKGWCDESHLSPCNLYKPRMGTVIRKGVRVIGAAKWYWWGGGGENYITGCELESAVKIDDYVYHLSFVVRPNKVGITNGPFTLRRHRDEKGIPNSDDPYEHVPYANETGQDILNSLARQTQELTPTPENVQLIIEMIRNGEVDEL